MDDNLLSHSPELPPTPDTTSALFESARNGQAGAFDALLQRYRPYLRVIAEQAIRQVFDRKFDASDAVQQTCLDAFRAIESFRGKSEIEFQAWLSVILRRNLTSLTRTHLAHKRDLRREIELAPMDGESSLSWLIPATSAAGPASRIVQGEAALLLAEALCKLGTRQRTAVQMRFLEGYKLADIAGYMEITTSSVARLIDRGLASLRSHLPRELADIA